MKGEKILQVAQIKSSDLDFPMLDIKWNVLIGDLEENDEEDLHMYVYGSSPVVM